MTLELVEVALALARRHVYQERTHLHLETVEEPEGVTRTDNASLLNFTSLHSSAVLMGNMLQAASALNQTVPKCLNPLLAD